MSKKLIPIAELIVHKGRPDNDNPFRGVPFQVKWPVTMVSGDERVQALRNFCGFQAGLSSEGYTFWSVVRGEVREVIDPYDVDWSGLRTPRGRYVEDTRPRIDSPMV